MWVCVARGGISVINLDRTMEDDGYDEKINATDSMLTGELNTTKATADLVTEEIDKSQ